MNNQSHNQLSLFLADLKYIRAFINQRFGESQILINKNKRSFPSSDFTIKESRIKGYAFHGYGCIFRFKNFTIDIDLRHDKVGFNFHNIESYFKDNKINVETSDISSFLKRQIETNNLELKEGIYLIKE